MPLRQSLGAVSLTLTLLATASSVTGIAQAPSASEWALQAPTAVGWRGVHPGMTIGEVFRMLENQVKQEPDARPPGRPAFQRAMMKRTSKIDGIDYEVHFRFDRNGGLGTIDFFSNTAKKETYAAVLAAFVAIDGAPDVRESLPRAGDTVLEHAEWKPGRSSPAAPAITVSHPSVPVSRVVSVEFRY